MRTVGARHVITLFLISLGATVLWPPATARAFSSGAVLSVVEAMESALPPAALPGPGRNGGISDAALRRLATEAQDIELYTSRHRFAVGSLVPGAAADSLAYGAALVTGLAPRELAAAAAGLRASYVQRDWAAAIEWLAALAIAATDLADPYQVMSLDQAEAPGARAAFSDMLLGNRPAALEARSSISIHDPLAAGVALAEQSAGVREAIEQAFARGDRVRFQALRDERLAAALGLAREIAFQAWRSAGAPELDPDGMHDVRLWPNPVRVETQMTFRVPEAGPVSVELFDLAGRRVWSKALGSLDAGLHSARLGIGDARHVPTGVYLVRVAAPRHVATGRLAYISR